MGHVQHKCAQCRRTVAAGDRSCTGCGSRRSTWVARYRGPNHVERSRSFAKKDEAERFIRAQESSRDDGDWLDPKRASITLAEFWAQQRAKPGKRGMPAPTTLAKWDTVFARYLQPALGTRALARITRADVRDTVAAVPSPWQGAEALKLLKMILYRAIDDDRLRVNVSARIEPPRTRRKAVRVLKPEELAAVVDALPDRWRAFVLLGSYGSLRWSELVAVKRDCIDIPGRTVSIRETCVELDGRFVWGDGKTAGALRTIALPDLVIKGLSAHLLRYPPGPDGLVFRGDTGDPVRRKTFRAAWVKALSAAGISEHVRPGWMRHSGASLAYDATKDMLATAQRLGHTSTRMVDSTYVELYSEVSRSIADAIDERASGDGGTPAAGQMRDER